MDYLIKIVSRVSELSITVSRTFLVFYFSYGINTSNVKNKKTKKMLLGRKPLLFFSMVNFFWYRKHIIYLELLTRIYFLSFDILMLPDMKISP